VWVCVLHADERVFWRTMNPVRLHALYSALYPQNKRSEANAEQPQSLLQYFMGGGG